MTRTLYISAFTFFVVIILGPSSLLAQPIYNMTNLTVDDCQGILLDSENGDVPMTYDHNENYTFSICIPGVTGINLVFQDFCTEENFDYMRFFEGPDTLSPLIGLYTGEFDPLPIVSVGECITINFISDANVTCDGWYAEWWVEHPEPVPVDILPIPDLQCESDQVILTFAENIPCDSVFASAFNIVGPQSPNITNATPVNCSSGMTNTVRLDVSSPFSVSGNYEVTYTTYEFDPCDELHVLRSVENFLVVNCPLMVLIEPSDNPICEGSCATIIAEASGGVPGVYTYTWDNGLPPTQEVQVCPLVNTTYQVIVTDALGTTVATQITIMVNPRPTIDTTNLNLCQSVDPFVLSATPPGGDWYGIGIDEDEQQSGLYDPGLVTVPQDSVFYEDNNGCISFITVDIIALDQGTDDASCPNGGPFQVSGGLPLGGFWSGPNIDSAGLFTPTDTGEFVVSYTHPNGCIGSKTITVGDIVMPVVDSVCQSAESFLIPVTPFGGTWSGPGIVNEDTGEFDPDEADEGENLLFYSINGCMDSLTIYTKAISAAFDLSACPDETPFVLPGNWNPAGGIWSGIGIMDSMTGLYNPGVILDEFNDTLSYAVNGCLAERIVYVRYTELGTDDVLEMCTQDDRMALNNQTIGVTPRNGSWSGPGIQLSADEWFFNPASAGPGTHQLIYDANTCTDTLLISVFTSPVLTPEVFCIVDDPVPLTTSLSGGVWSGPGIINAFSGTFDPDVAGAGVHTITNESANGCSAEVEIVVAPFDTANVVGVEDEYCFRDSAIILTPTPVGGVLLVNGIAGETFNPSLLGAGVHTINYSIGEGNCFSEFNATVEVGDPLFVEPAFISDTICFGEQINISASASGGLPFTSFDYDWDNSLGFGSNHLVGPEETTTYTVIVDDGCSDIASGSLEVYVHPEIEVDYTTGPAVCFDDSTTANVFASPGNDYSFTWLSDPPVFGNSIVSYPTSYEVEVVNNESGCTVFEDVQLPGYGPITANFNVSPNEDCISILNPEVEVLDLSVGASFGNWNFGDSTSNVPYSFGDNVQHSYSDVGNYTITLTIVNEGGCRSESQMEVCIQDDSRLFAPNAFTPNLDGKNDSFQLVGVGIEDINWQIFNRWGELVFTGTSLDDKWDGSYKGNPVTEGVYIFQANYKSLHSEIQQQLKGFVTVLY